MKLINKPLYTVLLSIFLLAGCSTHDLPISREEAYQAYQDGDYSTAVNRFEMLVQEIPGDADLWFRLGNSYARSMMPKQAVEAYQNSLLRDPNMGKAWYNMGLIHMQTALKSFIDMQDYVSEGDPVGRKGMVMRDGLFSLLGQNDDREQHN